MRPLPARADSTAIEILCAVGCGAAELTDKSPPKMQSVFCYNIFNEWLFLSLLITASNLIVPIIARRGNKLVRGLPESVDVEHLVVMRVDEDVVET
jgi:hypothetical protein